MNLTILDNIQTIDRDQWKDFVDQHPEGNFFQSPGLFDFLSTVELFEPMIIIAQDREKNIRGVLLASIIKEFSDYFGKLTARTIIYGGPLIEAGMDYENILDRLLQHLVGLVHKKSIFIQFRNFSNMYEYEHVFNKNGFRYQERLNFLVFADNPDNVRQRISESKMRQIRKSIKAGAEIVVPQTIGEVREFYEILFDLYHNKVRKPLPRWSFFENFFYQMNDGVRGVYLLVRFKNKIVGGVLCPIHNKKAIYEWYVCGQDKGDIEVYPSALATWAPIEYALNNGIGYFDFLGVGKPSEYYGVRQFKSKFGGDLVNYGRFGRINRPFFYLIAELGYNFLALIKKT